MSDQEQFLARWSRRKRNAKAAALPEKAPAPDPEIAARPAAEAPGEPARREPQATPAPAFDPTTLPPIETITAVTDVRPFLAPGVPAELTRAALRRVWTMDPSIRDFVGLADYDWDFNTPGAVPGFGAIEMTAQLRSEIARMVGRNLTGGESKPLAASSRVAESGGIAQHAAATQSPEPPEPERSQPPEAPASVPKREQVEERPRADVAAQPGGPPEQVAPRQKRPHGRALPQ